MPAHSGASGPTTTKSIFFSRAKAITAGMVGEIERDAFGLLRDAGIARRAIELVGERARGDLPGQRVLAPAGTEDEDVHAAPVSVPPGLDPAYHPSEQASPVAARDSRPNGRARAEKPGGMDRLGAFRRAQAHGRGRLRLRARARRDLRLPRRLAVRPLLLPPEGRQGGARGGDLAGHACGRMRVKPEEGLEVIVTGRLTTSPGSSNTRSSSTASSPPASAR